MSSKKMTKTSFNVGKHEWAFYKSMTDAVKLNRDAYTGFRLKQELNQLDCLQRNTDDDAKIISTSTDWFMLDKTKINVNLPTDTLQEMNAKCAEKNIPRPLFFHRFLEYQNITTFYAALLLRSPREISIISLPEQLEILPTRYPLSVLNFKDKVLDKCGSQGFEGDIVYKSISNYLDDFYKTSLNLSDNDERKEQPAHESQEDFDEQMKDLWNLEVTIHAP